MNDRPHFRVVTARIERGGRYLITQRRPQSRLPLLWEFPGGRVQPGESDASALKRALRDKTGVEITVKEAALKVIHHYEDYSLDLLVFRAEIESGEPHPLRVHAIAWATPEDLASYPFPPADQQTIDILLEDMGIDKALLHASISHRPEGDPDS